jgi:succinate dehydrogenase / fumarate reductase flavoprotein subunit
VVKPGAAQPPLPPRAGENSLRPLRPRAQRKGDTTSAEIRLQMQRTMQNHAAVFRNSEC